MDEKKVALKPTFEPSEEHIKRLEAAEKHQVFLSEKDLRTSVKSIRNVIKNEEARLRKKHKWLKYQDALGASAFLVSVISIIAIMYLYLQGRLHWAVVIPLLALPASILHELEHDIIHNLYFKSQKKWAHLRHHQVSGSKKDIEERLIGSGLPLGFLRWALILNPFANVMILEDIEHDNVDWNRLSIVLTSIPSVGVFAVMWFVFSEYLRQFTGLTFGTYDPATYLPLWAWPLVRDLAVLIVGPNTLRQSCLNIMASYSHYYGDVPEGSVFYQCQVIDSIWCLPFQLFCFDFGRTHIIHHFVPNQPFYLRHMLAPKAVEELVKQGIRRNDFGIVSRNNRYYENSKHLLEANKEQELSPEQIEQLVAKQTNVQEVKKQEVLVYSP
ncbi:hypothetical protein ABK040_003704 [Willaertia magna]